METRLELEQRVEERSRELPESERLRLALDAAEMGTYVWYPQEDRGEPDKRMLALFGLPETGTLNLAEALTRLIHPDDRAAYAEAVGRAATPGGDGSLRMEIRVVHPDGLPHWVEVNARMFFEGEPPRPSVMFGMASDITERKRLEANLAFLAEVSHDLTRSADISQTMNTLAAKIAAYFQASVCAFFAIGDDGETMSTAYAWSRTSVSNTMASVYHNEEFRRAGRAGETYVVRDASTDPRAALRAGALVNVPLMRDGEWRFNLSVADTAARDWRGDDIELIRELAMRIWTRLESARAEQILSESRRKLTSELADTKQLHHISSLLVEEGAEEGLYEEILDASMAIMRSDFGSMQLLDTADQALHLVAWRNFHPDAAAFWQRVAVATGSTCGAALQHGARIIVPDITQTDLVNADSMRHYLLCGIAAIQSTPLVTRDGRVIGMISTHWRKVHTPEERELRLLSVVARQAADFFERTRAAEVVRSALAEKDALLREVHHRVKNNLQVITSLLEMQARQVDEPRSFKLLGEARNRIASIASIHELLYRSGSFSGIDLVTWARQLAQYLFAFYRIEERIELTVSGEPVVMELERAVPFGLLLNEAISNVCRHAFPLPKRGELQIRIGLAGTNVRVEVIDNGVGLPAGLRGVEAPTLGLQLIRTLAHQVRGEVRITSGSGTTVELLIPPPPVSSGDELPFPAG